MGTFPPLGGAAEALHWLPADCRGHRRYSGEVRAITQPERRLVFRGSVLTQ